MLLHSIRALMEIYILVLTIDCLNAPFLKSIFVVGQSFDNFSLEIETSLLSQIYPSNQNTVHVALNTNTNN